MAFRSKVRTLADIFGQGDFFHERNAITVAFSHVPLSGNPEHIRESMISAVTECRKKIVRSRWKKTQKKQLLQFSDLLGETACFRDVSRIGNRTSLHQSYLMIESNHLQLEAFPENTTFVENVIDGALSAAHAASMHPQQTVNLIMAEAERLKKVNPAYEILAIDRALDNNTEQIPENGAAYALLMVERHRRVLQAHPESENSAEYLPLWAIRAAKAEGKGRGDIATAAADAIGEVMQVSTVKNARKIAFQQVRYSYSTLQALIESKLNRRLQPQEHNPMRLTRSRPSHTGGPALEMDTD